MIMIGLAPVASSPKAINCDEPAYTNKDMAIAPHIDKPLDSAKVPKIMPKGIAPMIIGIVAFAPVINSLERLVGMNAIKVKYKGTIIRSINQAAIVYRDFCWVGGKAVGNVSGV